MIKLYESVLAAGFLTDTIDMTRLRSPGTCAITVDGVATIVVEYFDGSGFVEFFRTSVTGSVGLPIADQLRVRVISGSSTTSRFAIYQADQGLIHVGAKSNLLTGEVEINSGGIDILAAVGAESDYQDVVVFGDSLWNNSFQFDGTNMLYLSKGVIPQALALLGNGRIIYDAADSGDNTQEMLDRIDAVIALRATSRFRCAVIGGTNDASDSFTSATTISNLLKIYAKLTQAGIPVDAFIYPPRYNATGPIRRHQAECAAWHRNLKMKLVNVIDGTRYIESADGSVPSNYFFDATMHFSGLGAGYYAMAYYNNRKASVVPYVGPTPVNSDCAALNGNPMLSGNNASGSSGFGYGAGLSGNGPDGGAYVSRSGSAIVAVMSKVARSDFKTGEWWRFVVSTPGANGDRIDASFDTIYRRRAQNTAISYNRVVIGANGSHYRVTIAGTSENTADPSAAWTTTVGETVTDGGATLRCVPTIVPGMTVEAVCECVVSGLSGVMGAQPRVRAVIYNTANTQLKIIAAGAWDSGQGLLPRAYPSTPLVYRSPEYTFGADFDLSAATTSTGPHIDLSVTLFMDGSATPTFDVGALALVIK